MGTPDRPAAFVVVEAEPVDIEYSGWKPNITRKLMPFMDKRVRIKAKIVPGRRDPNVKLIDRFISIEEFK